MFNKLYEWIGTGFTSHRDNVPADEHLDAHGLQQDGQTRRKRPINCVEDGEALDQDHDDQAQAAKKVRMGDLMNTVKTAAEGVKSHGSTVASWMKSSMTPTLRIMLGPSPKEPQPGSSTSAQADGLATAETAEVLESHSNPLDGTFVVPSTTLEWKTSKTESFRFEKPKVCRRQACMGVAHRDVAKTNGHSVSMPPCSTPKPCPPLRLGRPFNPRPHATASPSWSPGATVGGSSAPSVYEKFFPSQRVQSPPHRVSTRPPHARVRCTAQESVREEEKEVYRQLLSIVSGGLSSLQHNGTSHGSLRSHRDFSSFLSSSRRRLQCTSPAGSGVGEPSEGPSGPPSPRPESSQGDSNVPSPKEGLGAAGNHQAWAPDSDPSPRGPAALRSAPSPAALQDTSSQSSAHDGDSVIIVKEQKGRNPDSSSVPWFQAELWIKELTSMYDSRARERRRQIEEQEALVALLLRQRQSEEDQLGRRAVEVHVRVPLEKEVPLAPVVEEPQPADEPPEFPPLTEAMDGEVGRSLRGGNRNEVLSEGFGLTIRPADLQTLSHQNWLNDEVINFYMNMLVERSKTPQLPTAHAFNTFFFTKLRAAGYSAVRRWTKKVDIFSVDLLLVPVHVGDVHWCLSVVDLRKKSISYFDSMGGINDEACRILLQYLQQESMDKKGKVLEPSEWTLKSKRRDEIPQQMNGCDCGMFTCKFAEYITKDKPITFTQKHMPYFRRRMAWEILNKKLL